jgi:redox-sensitive bicupin YhaK (pirin superfamily)
MEIISYCVQGELTHSDSMGNQEMIRRGDVQYMCAGSGVAHAEMNVSEDQALRFIQVWILPDQRQLRPQYNCKSYSAQVRHNKLLQIASGIKLDGAFQIHQDANIFESEITKGYQVLFTQLRKRQSYLVCIEGNLDVNGIDLFQHEALRSSGEMEFVMTTRDDSHLLMVEMPEG